MNIVKITTNDEIEVIKCGNDFLKECQTAVNGNIEVVSFEGLVNYRILANEEGLINGMPVNHTAGILRGGYNRYPIVGDVVVVKTTKDDITGLSEKETDLMLRLVGAIVNMRKETAV